MFFSEFVWIFLVGVVIDVNGNRELVGLSERLGDVVGVVVEERIGD